MPDALTPQEAAARLEPTDTLGIPLGTGQPPAFMAALGERDDWADLRIYGALLLAWSEAFQHPHVHYLSGFFGPVERALRDQGANISFAPADFRRFEPLLEQQRRGSWRRSPRRRTRPAGAASRCTPAARSRSCARAGADPDAAARGRGLGALPAHPRASPPELPARAARRRDRRARRVGRRSRSRSPSPSPGEIDAAIAEHARRFIADGATLQTGIGTIPSAIVGRLAEGDGGDYGVHSEMFTNGLMRLHEAGKVTNRKGQFDGVSVATFAGGSPELYAWLEDNDEVAFLPVEVVNSPDLIGRNRMMVTINAALAVDIHGQVVADTIDGSQYSGIGGHEDFIAGPALSLDDRSLLCLPSTVTVGGEVRSRIVPWFDAGAVITTPRHQVDVIVTEHGAAELQGLTVHQRGLALAEIAHPDFRDELREAAVRASHGRSAVG